MCFMGCRQQLHFLFCGLVYNSEIFFPQKGVRFIAVNDGVGTIHKNNEMLVILKNVMKNISRWGAKNSKGHSGGLVTWTSFRVFHAEPN